MMPGMRVTTWNVLHRIHAVNWGEAPATTYPDERVRSARITARVVEWLRGDVEVVCLQEVSGDLLESLRSAVGSNVQVYAHQHPRVPALRVPSRASLTRPAEYLVTLSKHVALRSRGEGFETDGGKGVLEVQLAHVTVLNTHVSFGNKRVAQLQRLEALLVNDSLVLGDFNAPLEVIHAALGTALSRSELGGQLATRFGDSPSDGQHIDHVLSRGGAVRDAEVIDTGDVSDHRAVRAHVTSAPPATATRSHRSTTGRR